MRKKLFLCMTIAAMLSMAACGNNGNNAAPTAVPTQEVLPVLTETPEPTATTAPTATPVPTATPTPEIDWYQEMLDRSVMSTGNNARIKKVLEKARSGETVNVVTLGGSITEGGNASPMSKGYAYLFAEEFAKTYGVNGGENINYVNAGLSGTPSSLGALRYERDVLEALGTKPDLLFIEFEVNDYAEATKGHAYESIVYDVLSQDNDAAVVMIYSVRDDMWNVQNEHNPIAKYYDIPVVCMKDAISPAITKKYMTKNKYYSDSYHPNNYGHTVMKDCIMQLFRVIDAEEAEEMNEIPAEPLKGREYVGTKLVDSATEGIQVKAGSFTQVDTAVQQYQVKKQSSFPNNWKHDVSAGNEAFQMKLTCRKLLLNYKTGGNEFGSAEVFVDGTLVTTLNGSGGWNGSNVVLIVDGDTAAEHVVEVRMAEGQEDKTFTIYAFGYTE